jgi:serine/threonine protein kinase
MAHAAANNRNSTVPTTIGEGSYGKVFRLDAARAVKVEHGGSSGTADRTPLLRELAALQVLRDVPGVIELQEVVICKRRRAFVMPLAVGTLTTWLASTPVERRAVSVVLSLLRTVVGALAMALHNENLAHRDVKSPNVLVMADGTFRLIDWGLAAFDWTSQGAVDDPTVVQTLWYRPLEILLQQTRVRATKTDVWAVGVLACEALGHLDWFQGDSEVGQIVAVMRTCGTPTDATWRALYTDDEGTRAPTPCEWPRWDAETTRRKTEETLRQTLLGMGALPFIAVLGAHFIMTCLTLNPDDRPTAAALATHPFLVSDFASVASLTLPPPSSGCPCLTTAHVADASQRLQGIRHVWAVVRATGRGFLHVEHAVTLMDRFRIHCGSAGGGQRCPLDPVTLAAVCLYVVSAVVDRDGLTRADVAATGHVILAQDVFEAAVDALVVATGRCTLLTSMRRSVAARVVAAGLASTTDVYNLDVMTATQRAWAACWLCRMAASERPLETPSASDLHDQFAVVSRALGAGDVPCLPGVDAALYQTLRPDE